MNPPIQSEFEKVTRAQPGVGFLRELWDFLRNTKKWWLLPMIVVFLLFGVLLMLSGSAAAPFIYTLF